MCYVTLPAVPDLKLKERKAKVYVDLDTGTIYGSDKVTSRFQHKDGFVRANVSSTVENQVSNMVKCKVTPWLKGKIVREKTTDLFDKNTGKGSTLKFVSFD